MNYNHLYGKSSLEHQGRRYPHNSLVAHLLAVAASAQVIFEHPQNARRIKANDFPDAKLLVFICALHDIGKCSRKFQRLLNHPDSEYAKITYPQAKEWKHGADGYQAYAKTASEFICHKSGLSNNQVEVENVTNMLLAACAHHGKYSSDTSYSKSDEINESPELQRLLYLINDLMDLFNIQANHFTNQPFNNSFLHWFAGWVVLADWIGSDSDYFKPYTCDEIAKVNLQQVYDEYYQTAKQRIAELDLFKQGATREAGLFSEQLEEKLAEINAKLNPMQQWAADPPTSTGKNIIICEAPMGAGKTEFAEMIGADLIAKQQIDGLVFALPTQGSANQIHTRLNEDFSIPLFGLPANLAHANAKWEKSALIESGKWGNDSQRELIDWLYHNNKRCFLAPVSIVTVDQLELAVLNCKHSFLRAAAISRHVVIIDEIHAYDAYMSELIDRLLGFLGQMQTPVVLLSATLPTKTSQRLLSAYSGKELIAKNTAYPRISWITENDSSINSIHLAKQTAPVNEVKIAFTSGDGFLDEVINNAKEHCVCIICNTVFSALSRYRKLNEKVKDNSEISISLFHSRYIRQHRSDKESIVTALFDKKSTQSKRKGQILVATQVVEQSLDLDFDYLYSEIAPIDLILQRMGRLHRHQRPYRTIIPVLSIIIPNDETEQWFQSTQKIYAHPEILQKTLDVLQSYSTLVLPKDLGITVSKVYDDLPAPYEADKQLVRAAERSFDLSSDIPLNEQIEDTEESSNTRDAADSIDILLLMLSDGVLVLPDKNRTPVPNPINKKGKLSSEFLKAIHPYIISLSDSNPNNPDTLSKRLLGQCEHITDYFQHQEEHIKNQQDFLPFSYLLTNEYNDLSHFNWGKISGWRYSYSLKTGLIWEKIDEQ